MRASILILAVATACLICYCEAKVKPLAKGEDKWRQNSKDEEPSKEKGKGHHSRRESYDQNSGHHTRQDARAAPKKVPEFVRLAEATVKHMDKDHDDNIALAELSAYHKGSPAQKAMGLNIDPETIMIHADENNNNGLDKQEYTNWFHDHMELLQRIQKDWTAGDKNNDGKLTKDEYLKSPMGKFALKKGGKKAPMAEFKRMDKSKHGFVVKKDFLWYVSPDDFGSADVNNDGILTLGEYKHAPFHFHDYDERKPSELEEEYKRIAKGKQLTLKVFNADLKQSMTEDRDRDDDRGDEQDGRRKGKLQQGEDPNDPERDGKDSGDGGNGKDGGDDSDDSDDGGDGKDGSNSRKGKKKKGGKKKAEVTKPKKKIARV